MEWLHYVEPGYTKYRDHLVHMFKVAYAGEMLLAERTLLEKVVQLQGRAEHFQAWCKKNQIKLNQQALEEVVVMTFFIAALFHDFGYGYDCLRRYRSMMINLHKWMPGDGKVFELNREVTDFFLTSLLAENILTAHAWVSEYKTKIDKIGPTPKKVETILTEFIQDNISLNHSVASSLFVFRLCHDLWQGNVINRKLYAAFQLAAEAIMLHDMTGKGKWAHYLVHDRSKHFLHSGSCSRFPIAVLLILADELSTWNRPRIYPLIEDNSVTYVMNSSTEGIEIYVDDGAIHITTDEDSASTIQRAIAQCFGDNGELRMLDHKIIIERRV